MGRKLIGVTDSLITLANGTPGYSVRIFGNNSSSSYNSLQLQYNRRLANRVEALVFYAWSHSMDNLSNDTASPLIEPPVPLYLDPNANRGPSDFDVRHSLNGSLVLRLPSPRRSGLGVLLRDWTVSSIFFARSALPSDMYTLNAAYSQVRPDVIPGKQLYLYGSVYPGGKSYNPIAFAVPPVNELEGNFGRNVMRGFNAWQIDFSLHREIPLSESTSLQLRVEVFNILNHPNFANPSTAINDPQHVLVGYPIPGFGVASSTLATDLSAYAIPGELNSLFQIGGPRSLQFALRFHF